MTRKGRQAERKAARERVEAAKRQAQAIVRSGRCPDCGSDLRRNSALAGWWQCEQYGDGHFRARPADPPCNWQGFTE